MQSSDPELMQYRRPPRAGGPSGNTWPRWLSPWVERTSVLIIPCAVSRNSRTWADSIGLVKLGQPQWASNLSDEANRDRTSVVKGKSVSVRVDLGGRRNLKKQSNEENLIENHRT